VNKVVAASLALPFMWLAPSQAHAENVTASPTIASDAPIATGTLIAQSSTVEQLIQENRDLKLRLERLEKLAGVNPKAPEPLLPKNGFYIQGDLGYQYRDLAGEDGNTWTAFYGGFYGSGGIGYRLNKNFRFGAEYANLSSNASRVASSNGSGGSLSAPGLGAITLNQYTFNAYYDVDGFGPKKRYRPYVGLGVGTNTSSIIQVSNTIAAQSGLYSNGVTSAPVVTFEAGINYVVTKNFEAYAGGKYALGSELLFNNTAFGNLLPQSSRNWILKAGLRYTF
jgi:Opacity family porin protein